MSDLSVDSKQRFTSRVSNYVRFRPGYPREIIEVLQTVCALSPDSIVADIGSGTGFLSDLFLANGNMVLGVEPNAAMRDAAEFRLSSNTRFVSVDGTAEHTTLTSSTVDIVAAAQAFHWFDAEAARTEFRRILKPGGWVVLVWNERTTADDALGEAYHAFLMEYALGYEVVTHRTSLQTRLQEFFHSDYSQHVLPNSQTFDWEGLQGRLLSSSYSPEPGHPKYDVMMRGLRDVFDRYQVNGQVQFLYDTNVYCGRV
ncbi:MAG: class I SAM-dependent methyltransferase [Gemmatimonas sp.]